MKVRPSLLVVLAVLAMAVGVYIGAPGSQAMSAQNSQAVAPRVSAASAGLPGSIRSAGSLLSHPVYDTQVKTYGRVSGLAEMSCPCFVVTSGGERLEVWFNLTAQEPVAEVPAIQNGDWVTVAGQLKPGVLGLGGRTFWASHIERLPEP
jgi:hypothetical protein